MEISFEPELEAKLKRIASQAGGAAVYRCGKRISLNAALAAEVTVLEEASALNHSSWSR